MDTQLIALAVLVVALVGGLYFLFRDPPKRDPNRRDDFLEKTGGPPVE